MDQGEREEAWMCPATQSSTSTKVGVCVPSCVSNRMTVWYPYLLIDCYVGKAFELVCIFYPCVCRVR